MKVVHVGMVYASSGKTVYAAQVVACRWRDKAAGKWTGRHVEDTGARLTFEGRT